MTAPVEGEFEIVHVLCTDIVGYSKLPIDQQAEYLRTLNEVVRSSDTFQRADGSGKLLRIPTGDGMILVFFSHPQDPAECAVQIATELKSYPHIQLRMGVHSGPVNRVADVNERSNVAGAGINFAQRIMDCGDAGHILVSKRVAEDLAHYSRWRPQLHDLGQCEVKHGVVVDVVNLYNDQIGNPTRPAKLAAKAVAAPSQASRWTKPLVIAALVILIGAGAWFFLQSRNAPVPSQQLATIFPGKSVAIAPFKPLVASNRDEVLEAGMADTLINKLSTSREIIVPSLSSVRNLDDQKHDPVTIGRELRVNTVLEGNVQKVGNRIRVTARLIKVADGSSLWAQTFDEKFTDVFAVQDAIAQKVATALALKLSEEEQQRLIKRYTDNTEAYQLYLKGRFYWNKYTEEGFRKAIEYFKQALEKDPNYALAYSGLADAYSLLGEMGVSPPQDVFPQARLCAEKASKLDEKLADAHLSMGIVNLFYEWDWAGAETELNRAKELNPNNAQVYHFRGHYLEFMKQVDAAVEETRRGVELDPTNLIINSELGLALYFARQPDQAIAQLRKTLQLDPSYSYASLTLAQVYEFKGAFNEALAELNRARPISNDWTWILAELGYLHALMGDSAEAQQLLAQLQERMGHEYVDPGLFVYVYVGLGDIDRAFEWLDKGIQLRSGLISGWVQVDPHFDRLRSDPRFPERVRSMGLK